MPFLSKKQAAWAHTKKGMKALGGPEKVDEWGKATDFKKLPTRKKKEAATPKPAPRLRRTTLAR